MCRGSSLSSRLNDPVRPRKKAPRKPGGQERAVLTDARRPSSGRSPGPPPLCPPLAPNFLLSATAWFQPGERGRTPRTFRSEARKGLEELREAEVVEAGEPLGFVAAQRGDAGNEGVGDELLHRLHALGHDRGRAPGLRPASEPSLPQPPPPARPGAAPLRSLQPTARSRRCFGFRGPSPSLPPLRVPRGFASHPGRWGHRPPPLNPPYGKALVTVRQEPPCWAEP